LEHPVCSTGWRIRDPPIRCGVRLPVRIGASCMLHRVADTGSANTYACVGVILYYRVRAEAKGCRWDATAEEERSVGSAEEFEFISDAPNGFEDPLVADALKFFSESLDVDVNSSGVTEVIEAPDLVEELISCENSVII